MPVTVSLRSAASFRSYLVRAWTLVAILLIASVATVAYAQSAVEVTPAVLRHERGPGGSADGVFVVANPTAETVRARVSLSDWHYRIDGTPTYLEGGTLERSLAPFLTLNPPELLLEPGTSSEVRYTVDLPDDVTPGSYWGALFVESEDPDPTPGFDLARFSVRVGHVVYVDVPPLTRDGAIAGLFGVPSEDGDTYTLAIQYANTGDTVQRLDGWVELRDAVGERLFRDTLPPRVTLPGDVVGRTFDVYGPLEPGLYTALVVYNYGDDTVDVAADHTFRLEQGLPDPATVGPDVVRDVGGAP